MSIVMRQLKTFVPKLLVSISQQFWDRAWSNNRDKLVGFFIGLLFSLLLLLTTGVPDN